MKKIALLLCFTVSISMLQAAQHAKTGDLQFIQNNGQWASNILFSTPVGGGTLFLENNCFTYSFSNGSALTEFKHGGNPADIANFIFKKHAYRASFINANQKVIPIGENKFANHYNYFLGDNQVTWEGKVPAFGAVRYPELYPGTDLLVYSQSNSVKYDFIIAPGSIADNIKIKYEGLDKMEIVAGNLELTTSLNKVMELHPIAYQIINGIKTTILCEYILEENTISFSFPNGYDKNYELTIDPATLIFASYSGSSTDNWGYSATFDADGNLYGAGIAFNDGYPVTLGAFQTDWATSPGVYVADITISKFTPDGTSLIYSTYLGGTNQDLPYSIIVNSDNELIVYGATGSSNFPTTPGAYDQTFNGGTSELVDYVLNFTAGSDAYVAKFNVDGSDLLGATFFGGSQNEALNTGVTSYNYGDHARGEVNVNASENIIIASCTRSSNLPTSAVAFQPDFGGLQDGFIAQFNTNLTNLIWSSYIGGTADDGAYSIKPLTGGNYLICGGTASVDFPTTAGVVFPAYGGGTADGFVSIVSSDASTIIASTYIGTTDYDQSYLADADASNGVYIMGQTLGDFPVVGDVYENPGTTQFVSKLTPDLTEFEFSTVFGSGSSQVNISPTAFLVDNCGNIFVCGWGGNVNQSFNPSTGSVDGMETTPDAFQSTTDGDDFYLGIFDDNMSSLFYATFFGGPNSDEHVDGGTSRFDKQGVVYHAVCAGCGSFDDFPTTDGVVSNTNNSPNCNLGVFKFSLAPPPTSAAFDVDPAEGCYPLDVTVNNGSVNADYYDWDFGDGETSTIENPTYTYETPGTYTLTLIASVDDGCGISDTVYATVQVFDYPEAGFESTPENASVFAPVNFSETSSGESTYLWEFGDGTVSEEQNPVHFFPAAGIYEVCLTVTNNDGCADKVCDTVIIEEISILEVPNAFSPNSDDSNDEFIPLNYGLTNYEFTVYNRWGEIVFQTNSTTEGWDGYFEGELQEIGTYVYVVSGNGIDNVTYFKQGNFTLVL